MPGWGTIEGGSRYPIPVPEHAITNTILAIDYGKFNSVLCPFDTKTREASDRSPDAELRMVE